MDRHRRMGINFSLFFCRIVKMVSWPEPVALMNKIFAKEAPFHFLIQNPIKHLGGDQNNFLYALRTWCISGAQIFIFESPILLSFRINSWECAQTNSMAQIKVTKKLINLIVSKLYYASYSMIKPDTVATINQGRCKWNKYINMTVGITYKFHKITYVSPVYSQTWIHLYYRMKTTWFTLFYSATILTDEE